MDSSINPTRFTHSTELLMLLALLYYISPYLLARSILLSRYSSLFDLGLCRASLRIRLALIGAHDSPLLLVLRILQHSPHDGAQIFIHHQLQSFL